MLWCPIPRSNLLWFHTEDDNTVGRTSAQYSRHADEYSISDMHSGHHCAHESFSSFPACRPATGYATPGSLCFHAMPQFVVFADYVAMS